MKCPNCQDKISNRNFFVTVENNIIIVHFKCDTCLDHKVLYTDLSLSKFMQLVKVSSIEIEVLKSCQEAFHLGITQTEKKRLKQYELYEKVNWIRGYYKKVIWEAYKAGLWAKTNKND